MSEMSTLPTIDYDPEVEADCIVQFRAGELTCWFAMTDQGDRLIAFEMDDGEGKTCGNPDPEEPEVIRELTLSFPGRRCFRCLDGADFVANWKRRTGKYLFPKKVGRLRVDLPLDEHTPLDILADWLQDRGHERSAEILRRYHQPDDHKEIHKMWDNHVRKLWVDYAEQHARPNPRDVSIAQLLLWSHNQTINPTEAPQ